MRKQTQLLNLEKHWDGQITGKRYAHITHHHWIPRNTKALLLSQYNFVFYPPPNHKTISSQHTHTHTQVINYGAWISLWNINIYNFVFTKQEPSFGLVFFLLSMRNILRSVGSWYRSFDGSVSPFAVFVFLSPLTGEQTRAERLSADGSPQRIGPNGRHFGRSWNLGARPAGRFDPVIMRTQHCLYWEKNRTII